MIPGGKLVGKYGTKAAIAGGKKVIEGAAWLVGKIKKTSSKADDFGTIGVRIDNIDDITKYGTNLGKNGQFFVTNKDAISGLDLTNPADLAKAEEILGLPSGRLVNSKTNVLTEIDLTGKEVRIPTQGNEFFVPGGKTSGGAIERVIDPLNIFEDSGVKSIQFIKQVP